MNRLPLRRIRSHALSAGFAAVAFAAVAAEPAVSTATKTGKLSLPTSVLDSVRLHERWMTAFNGWRNAKSTWPGETMREANLRRETQLLILPSPVPLMGAQRRNDGRAIVVSSGLIALVQELTLAETVQLRSTSADCFDSYGQIALTSIKKNHFARSNAPAGTPSALSRLTVLVDAGKAPEECQALTRAHLRSGTTTARVAAATDAVTLWLLTWQNLRLAALPELNPPSGPAEAASAASAASESAARVAALCPAATASDIESRAYAAAACAGLRPLKTMQWLFSNRNYLATSGDLPPER
jgi:hypothetical protein